MDNVAVIVRRGARGFDETVTRARDAVKRRGLTVFATIDHAAGAREAGLELGDELVLVFGNARSGTPLMQSDPQIGIELPLRMLVWSDSEGVQVGYRDPRELISGYGVGQHASTLDRMAALLEDVAREAAG